MTGHWPPIPPHAVRFAGSDMLPERIEVVDGRPYVRCFDHGLIPAEHRCADSPLDHYCGQAAHPNQPAGEDQDDQGCSWERWDTIRSLAMMEIAHLHEQGEVAGGGVSGFCAHCDWVWPCPTRHLANGWGDVGECADAGWCSHAGVPLPAR